MSNENQSFKIDKKQTFINGINQLVVAANRDKKPVILKDCQTVIADELVKFSIVVAVEGRGLAPIMHKEEFIALLHLLMCSDPYPCDGREALTRYADSVAMQFGYQSWIVAYNEM